MFGFKQKKKSGKEKASTERPKDMNKEIEDLSKQVVQDKKNRFEQRHACQS